MEEEPIIPIITLQDIDDLLGKKPNRVKAYKKVSFKAAGLFAILFIIFFLVSNFDAFGKKLGYFLNPPQNTAQVNNTPENLPIVNLPQLKTTNLPNNRLMIEKLNVDAPIIWNIKEENIIENLKNGVVHYAGSYLPDENGNVFITGHSSNYVWDDGKYKDVFALLEKIEVGDEIKLTYKNNLYTYKVESKKVVTPQQVDVLYGTDKQTLSLMTCVPVGTNLRRLIVKADLISSTANQGGSSSLPSFLGD